MLDKRSRRKWLKSAFISSASALSFMQRTSAADNKNILKYSHKLPELDYDIVVCGGGPGGVCAAVAAARLQKRVLLVEQTEVKVIRNKQQIPTFLRIKLMVLSFLQQDIWIEIILERLL